jgi:hypothetical protein
MKNVANGLARYGRNGDNNLVHVSDKELAGIEQLTGRRFTTNPHTGLPEAFNFASLLPIAAGVAGTALGGPLGGAAAAGLTGAALGAAQGDSTERALTKGLIAGATTYAGGQLLSGVGEAATQAATSAATEGATQAATQVGTEAATQAATQAGTEAAAQTAAASGPIYPDFTPGELVAAGGTPSPTPAAGISGQLQPSNGGQLDFRAVGSDGKPITPFMDRAANAFNNPEAALSQIGSNIKANPISAAITAGGTYAMATDPFAPVKMPGETPYDPSKYPERFPSQPRKWNAPSSDYRPGTSPEYRYFAKGGLADLRQGDQETTANLMNEAKAALLGEHPKPQEAIARFRSAMGDDAFMALKDRITGGRIRGAGGGLDDLVPGSIEGRQKVRLADGEFILPSDVVSAIGDGSTDAGARRLHEMMDGIRKQKTGSTKQPGRLKAGSLVHEQ